MPAQVDVLVLDEASREVAGRPWITLAVDVMTRMVTGFHLALKPPSRTSRRCRSHGGMDCGPFGRSLFTGAIRARYRTTFRKTGS